MSSQVNTGFTIDTMISKEESMSLALECSICLSFIVEPVTISCGHSFCKMCLVKTLRKHKKKWYV